MIVWGESLACGNATRLLLSPSGLQWRLDRWPVDAPVDVLTVEAEPTDGQCSVTDWRELTNGVAYRYQLYAYDGAAWTEDGDPVDLTPAASYDHLTPDPQSVLIERVDAGLRVEVARGTLRPAKDMAYIEVLRSPPLFDESRMPVVTVEFASANHVSHAIGRTWLADQDQGDGWKEQSGTIDRWELVLTGWTLNPDERQDIRKALDRIVRANYPVFDGIGLNEVELVRQDVDDFESFSVPVYSTLVRFNCTALTLVGAVLPKIEDVEVTLNADAEAEA